MKINTRILLVSIAIIAFGAVSCKTSSSSKSHSSKGYHQNNSSNAIVKTARGYLGTPYKYGGLDKRGMDCSGLVVTCYKEQQVPMPRTSKDQSLQGEKIALSEIRPGDLVFFCEKKGKKIVDHVGIVSVVNSKNDIKFIHSSTSKGVIESDFFVDYYYSVFLFAKRILP